MFKPTQPALKPTRSTRAASTPSRGVISMMLLCAGLACALAMPARAQDVAPSSAGQDFAGLQFDLPAQPGGIAISARKVFSWTVAGASGAPVQRLMLIGDASVKVGPSTFSAARATIWLERLDPAPGSDLPRHQIAVFFDRVGNATASSGTSAAGDRLLTAAVVDGPLTLSADAPPTAGEPTGDAFLIESHARFARYLQSLENPGDPASAEPILPAPSPDTKAVYVPGLTRPYEPGSPLGPDGPANPAVGIRRAGDSAAAGLGAGLMGDQRLFAPQGLVTIAAGDPSLQQTPEENIVVITGAGGGVSIQYSEPLRDRSLQISAQRAVIFIDPGELQETAKLLAQKIRGIYLEGDVIASDGRFTLRCPQIYYDLKNNTASMVDAVFWTYDERRGLPLYVRAQAIRQTARNRVEATGVTLAASSFFEPQLAIGAKSVTVTREPRDPAMGGGERVMIAGQSLAPQIAGLPFFWFPSYKGDIERFPIKDVRFENGSATGTGIQTRWDLFGLTGIAPPASMENVDLDLLVDLATKRGIGLGLDSAWRDADSRGSFFGYWLPSDSGTDVLQSGARKDRSSEGRGIALFEQRMDLDPNWRLFMDVSHVSDETFVAGTDPLLAETRREFSTGFNLRRLEDNTSFAIQAKGNLNDFSPNEYILQSQGATVNKLPEVSYTRIGDDLFSDSPGFVTWTHEYRFGRVGFEFLEQTASDLGYSNASLANRAFGLAPNQTFAQRLRAAGFNEAPVTRADTRQQFTMNLDAGPIKITPFVVGRATKYDDKFSALATGGQDEDLRLWYSGGVRMATTLQRVYADAQSSFLDINGLRHVITPSITAWSAGSNRASSTLPIYDPSVEGLTEGSTIAFAVDQTLQTKRGIVPAARSDAQNGSLSGGRDSAAGLGHVADFLKLRTEAAFSSSDTDPRGSVARFVDVRPEMSNLRDFVNVDAAVLLTDALTLTTTNLYDLDNSQNTRTTAGVQIDHGRDFSTFAELRFINPLDSTFIDLGLDYRLTSKYAVQAIATLDSEKAEFQTVNVRLDREFPDVTFSVKVGYDDITNEVNTGVLLTPLGRNRRSEQMRRLGRDRFLDPISPVPGPTSDAP